VTRLGKALTDDGSTGRRAGAIPALSTTPGTGLERIIKFKEGFQC
jgi:hypothetical protein